VPTGKLPSKRRHDYARFGRFGLVGVINTLIDFGVYNLMSGLFRLSLVQSNIISTTIAMAFSFTANQRLVFKPEGGSVARQGALFIAVTAFGLYVLQTATIKLLTDVWPAPLVLGVSAVHVVGLHGHDQFLIKNAAKAVATVVSLTWNYVMYKKVVFV